jgi:hypothetical protein
MCSNPIIVNLIKGDQKESSPGNGPEIITVSSGVSLNLTTLTLLVSETETLTATVHNNTMRKAVTWTSSDTFVATVSGGGLVTALAAGTVTIMAAVDDKNASCTVTVRESTGKADAPFIIRNELELRQVGTTDNWNLSAHYRLAADITLNGDWTPISDNSSESDATRFTGSFNGNHKTITALSFNKPNANFQGMFGLIGSGGEVKNLTLVECNVYGNYYVGGVAGANMGTVDNCYITGMISGNKYVGSVVGFNQDSTVINSRAICNVSGTSGVGGVAGYNTSSDGTVGNCYATGNVSGDENVGGVVGRVSSVRINSRVANCVALNPNINSMDTQYGRIIGIVTTVIITNNYARRDMKHNGDAGIWTNTTNSKDGADITAADYQLQSWWSGSAGFDFSTTGVWEWHSASRLPVLKGLGTQNPQ